MSIAGYRTEGLMGVAITEQRMKSTQLQIVTQCPSSEFAQSYCSFTTGVAHGKSRGGASLMPRSQSQGPNSARSAALRLLV